MPPEQLQFLKSLKIQITSALIGFILIASCAFVGFYYTIPVQMQGMNDKISSLETKISSLEKGFNDKTASLENGQKEIYFYLLNNNKK